MYMLLVESKVQASLGDESAKAQHATFAEASSGRVTGPTSVNG